MLPTIIIPARLAAQRLTRKPLRKLGQHPLIVRVLHQAQRCRNVANVIVATDSKEIAEVVEANGGLAMLTKASHPSGTDRVAEVAEKMNLSHIINVQGDEPFIQPADIDSVAASLLENPENLVTLKCRITNAAELKDPSVVKVVTANQGHALYFSRAPIPFSRDRSATIPYAFKHIGVYGYTMDTLRRLTSSPPHELEQIESLEQLRALAMGITIKVLPAQTTLRGIDTDDDLRWANQRVQELGERAFTA